MNRDEAKFILGAYAPDGQDDRDPQFQEALELMKRDPELAQWFRQEHALDGSIAEKLNSFPVPPSLKGQLIAARKVIPLTPWWRHPAWLSAAAACAVLLVSFAVFFLRQASQPDISQFRDYAAETVTRLDRLDVSSNDLAELKRWLQNRNAPGQFIVPAKLDGQPSLGCRVFQWKGRPVSLVCFALDNNREAHLFVIECSSFRELPGSATPAFATDKAGITTAAWCNGQCVYVLATDAGENTLRKLL